MRAAQDWSCSGTPVAAHRSEAKAPLFVHLCQPEAREAADVARSGRHSPERSVEHEQLRGEVLGRVAGKCADDVPHPSGCGLHVSASAGTLPHGND